MAFGLLAIGILLIVVAVRNMQAPFLALLGGDFSGPGNFVYWVVALVAIGAVGYIPKAKPVSDALIVLILVALILARGNPNQSGGGVFTQLEAAITTTKTPSASSITQSGTSTSSLLNTGINSLSGVI